MSRSHRAKLAEQTLRIVEDRGYANAAGSWVDLGDPIAKCLEGTRLYAADDIARLRQEQRRECSAGQAAKVDVVNETTLAGLAALLEEGDSPVGVLNFASAKNPGGGFLGGSQAQEESLARCSALYASLMRAEAFYRQHRASSSLLYSDAMILSPSCPVFRDDEGTLLDAPRIAGFITSAAPNAGAIVTNRPDELALIEETFIGRVEGVLALAAAHGYRRLVLGAWGCGVFRNDPAMVAGVFARHLKRDAWAGRFDRVRFSVLDTAKDAKTLTAFEQALSL
jgi:uncharacterized protein (TIGR02452 family)